MTPPISATQQFRIRAHRPRHRFASDKWPKVLPGAYDEPAEAADAAEQWLKINGMPGQSFCDLLFNGDEEAHASIFFMDYRAGAPHFGVWNREGVPWPIDYIDSESGEKLGLHPHFMAEGEDDMPEPPPPAEEGKHEKGENNKMRIDTEDEEDEDEWEDEDDDLPGGAESDSEDDEGEDGSEDESEPEGAEDGSEDDPEADDDEGEGEDEGDEDGNDEGDEDSEDDDAENDGEGDSDEGDDDGESDTENEEEEEEPEMPRLTIFAKMRGPKGWRKRADAEDLNERNVFGFKIGVLDPEAPTPGKQERDVRVDVKFTEVNDSRKTGFLEIVLPYDCEIVRAKEGGRKWIAQVPYYDNDN